MPGCGGKEAEEQKEQEKSQTGEEESQADAMLTGSHSSGDCDQSRNQVIKTLHCFAS